MTPKEKQGKSNQHDMESPEAYRRFTVHLQAYMGSLPRMYRWIDEVFPIEFSQGYGFGVKLEKTNEATGYTAQVYEQRIGFDKNSREVDIMLPFGVVDAKTLASLATKKEQGPGWTREYIVARREDRVRDWWYKREHPTDYRSMYILLEEEKNSGTSTGRYIAYFRAFVSPASEYNLIKIGETLDKMHENVSEATLQMKKVFGASFSA